MAGHRRTEREQEQQVDQRLASLLAAAPRHGRPPGYRDHSWSRDEPAAAESDAVEADDIDGDEVGAGVEDDVGWDAWTGPGRRKAPRSDRAMPGDDQAVPGRREFGESMAGRLVGSMSRRFERPQLVVVTVIVLVGLLLAGWAVLRARPVAIASPAATGRPFEQGSPSGPVTATASPARTAGTTARSAGSGGAAGVDASAPASPGVSSPTAMIEIHVLGAVHRPGVVALPVGARVDDAVRRAGGLRSSAHLGALNLAQPLGDGQQVFISRGGGASEVRDPTAPVVVPPAGGSAGGGGPGAVGGASAPPQGPVDLNAATLEQLDQLPGIGPVTAQKILDWRQQNGRFSSVEELQEVDGIGPKTFADLQPLVTV